MHPVPVRDRHVRPHALQRAFQLQQVAPVPRQERRRQVPDRLTLVVLGHPVQVHRDQLVVEPAALHGEQRVHEPPPLRAGQLALVLPHRYGHAGPLSAVVRYELRTA